MEKKHMFAMHNIDAGRSWSITILWGAPSTSSTWAHWRSYS